MIANGQPSGWPFLPSDNERSGWCVAPAGPAVAGRGQRDLVHDQALLEHGNGFRVAALVALVLGRGRLRADLGATILAVLVAQRLAIRRLVLEDADADLAHIGVAQSDHDTAILRLTHAVASRHKQVVL